MSFIKSELLNNDILPDIEAELEKLNTQFLSVKAVKDQETFEDFYKTLTYLRALTGNCLKQIKSLQ